MTALPYSQACENNREPILRVLESALAPVASVLEVGSGTGQHATAFAAAMPELRWQPSDLAANLPILRPRCEAYAGANLGPALALDVRDRPWPRDAYSDALFTANTLHIMAWPQVETLLAALSEYREWFRLLAVYGPFNYGGHYSSESNARFDQWLAQRDPCLSLIHI